MTEYQLRMTPTAIASVSSRLITARQRGAPYPPPTDVLGEFDLAAAYRVQRAYVAAWATSDPVAGYKAAVTGVAMQKAFGLPGPITGVLLGAGARIPGANVAAADYRSLLIETELAFRLNAAVSEPLADVAALQPLIAACAPTIELADPGFGRTKFRGEDLVATNSACGGWIEGTGVAIDALDLNAQTVRLYRDNELLHEARSDVVQGDQWQALLWLVNQVVAQGYEVGPDHLLLTGAIGAAHPGLPGNYRAEYSDLGTIEFRVN